jgi:hypothetical protein
VRAALALCLWASLAAQEVPEPAAQEVPEPAAEVPAPPPPPPPPPPLGRVATRDELALRLAELAARHPDVLRLEALGPSAGGEELWLAELTALEEGERGRKPGLLLVGGLAAGEGWSAELVLRTLADLARRAEEPAVAALLARAVVYAVPCAHPDLVLAPDGEGPPDEPAQRLASLDANFEVGWRPRAAEAGPYPLSAPEAEALARFLLEHENLAAVLVYATGVGRGAPAGLEVLDADDSALHRREAAASPALGGPGSLVGLPDAALDGGSLLEFAYGHRGAFAWVAEVGPAPGAEAAEAELAAHGARAAAVALALGEGLPELELAPLRVQRLGRELWQIDLEVHNRGRLPTQSSLGARRFAVGPPRLGVAGAVLCAAAVGSPGRSGFEVAETRGQAFAIGELAGGSARKLRVVLRDTDGGGVTFEARAPRAGSARLEVVLE